MRGNGEKLKTGRLQDHKVGRNRKSLLSIVDAAGVGLKVRERDNAIAGLVWSGLVSHDGWLA